MSVWLDNIFEFSKNILNFGAPVEHLDEARLLLFSTNTWKKIKKNCIGYETLKMTT